MNIYEFLIVCAEIFASQTWQQLTIMQGEEAGCGGPGLAKLSVICGCVVSASWMF